MVEKKVRDKENIFFEPKVDFSLFKKKTSSKTFNGWLIGKMKQFRDSSNPEMVMVIQEIYKKHEEYNKHEKVYLESWKGKSSFSYIVEPDKFIVTTFQKSSKEEEPREVKMEITKFEVNEVLATINKLKDDFTKIPSRYIGESVYKKPWNAIFSDRHLHTQLNLILRLLDKLGIIHYLGGFTEIIKTTKEIQEILK